MIRAVLPQGWGHCPPPQRHKGPNTPWPRDFSGKEVGAGIREGEEGVCVSPLLPKAEGTVGLSTPDWSLSILTLGLVLPPGERSGRGRIHHSADPW